MMERMTHFMSQLRQAHRNRLVPTPPLGFDARVMADIRAMIQEADVMGRLLPRFTMTAMAFATVALIYGMTLIDTVPQALAGMYTSTAGFGF